MVDREENVRDQDRNESPGASLQRVRRLTLGLIVASPFLLGAARPAPSGGLAPGARASISIQERGAAPEGARLVGAYDEASRVLELRIAGNEDRPGPSWLLIGLTGTDSAEVAQELPGGTLLVGHPLRVLRRGAGLHRLPLRDLAGLSGTSWSLQAAVWTPEGIVLTQALDVSVAGASKPSGS